MNKRAYIFCLVAAVIVATFVIGYNIGTDKQSKARIILRLMLK